MVDIFTDAKFRHLYTDLPPRPQPSDFAVSFFKGKEGLTFVDIGAADGVTWNNSLPFELNYNWDGLCIEPHPVSFKKLTENRKTKCLNLAISDKDEEVSFIVVEGYAEMLSGITKHFDNRHKDRLVNDVENHNDKAYKQRIMARTLQSVLEEHSIKEVNYLSVDTEGAELAIMRGINFNKTKIDLISLEVNYELDPVNNTMNEYGYKFLEKVCGDAFYTKA